ncbi:FecR domain-containing protein [Oricola indica]|jgi:hypothetical protein|uniref:FecR domain-containing protein n=1 Tax=Oricola indica TaxID=2872591 RepID=UPI001CC13F34|nr:FecR domain-containing protein [Oricola indica]
MLGTTKYLLAGAVCMVSVASAQAQDVGTMTMEQSTVMRGGARVTDGTGIALGDQLAANATGSGVIVFKDESTARMGPNAVLTIDEFVYDPSRRNGTIRLRQTNGLARIYGGQISKRGRSEVRTPHIVLVVRGGIVDTYVDEGDGNGNNGETITTLRGGIMKCTVGDETRTVTNPGMSCVSDGETLTITRNTQSGGQLVPPAGQGGGTSSGGNYDQANCASANASASCKSDNGGLPRPGTNTQGRDPLGGGASGGGRDDCDPEYDECYIITY